MSNFNIPDELKNVSGMRPESLQRIFASNPRSVQVPSSYHDFMMQAMTEDDEDDFAPIAPCGTPAPKSSPSPQAAPQTTSYPTVETSAQSTLQFIGVCPGADTDSSAGDDSYVNVSSVDDDEDEFAPINMACSSGTPCNALVTALTTPDPWANVSRAPVEDAASAAIRKVMDERRQTLERQTKVDAVQSAMCERVRSIATPAVRDAVSDLFNTNRDLYNYVRKLEALNNSIWCKRCDGPMEINDPAFNGVSALATEDANRKERDEKLEATRASMRVVNELVNNLKKEYEARMADITDRMNGVKCVLAGLTQS